MLEKHLNTFLLGKKLKVFSMKRQGRGYLWEAKWLGEKPCCLKCGSDQTIKSGKATTTVREESLRGQALWVKIHKHRYSCKECRKSFTEPVEGIWPRRRSTQRFRLAVAHACGRMTDLSLVSRVYKVSHGFAYKVYYEQVEVKLNERRDSVKWPEVVGLDEHFFRRKNGVTEFVSVLTDLKKKRIFEMAHGKDRHSLEAQLAEIPGRENVRVVAIDMSSSYKSFVKRFFPNAVIVADKFHVLRLLSPSIMKRGKNITGHRQELSIRRKLLRSRVKLDYFVRSEIDAYLKQHPELDELYRWKEKLFEFYRVKGFERAVEAFRKLTDGMAGSNLPEILRLRRTLLRWKNEVLCYFETGYTNAFTERTNGTGKLVQRRAFGYRSFRNYRLRTLSACLFRTF